MTKMPALKNCASVVFTIRLVWNSVSVSDLSFFVVIYSVIRIIALKIVTKTELRIPKKDLVLTS